MRSTLIRRFATPVSTPTANSIARSSTSKPAAPSSDPPREPASQQSRLSPRTKRAGSKSAPLSLEHFLLRSRVLNLYRTIARAIYQIPDKHARREYMEHCKGEFRRNRDVTDTSQIRYLASEGSSQWSSIRRYIEELGARSQQLRGK